MTITGKRDNPRYIPLKLNMSHLNKDGWETILSFSSMITFLYFKYFYVHPRTWGRWTHFDEHIFQRGWFNHQLDLKRWECNCPFLWPHPDGSCVRDMANSSFSGVEKEGSPSNPLKNISRWLLLKWKDHHHVYPYVYIYIYEHALRLTHTFYVNIEYIHNEMSIKSQIYRFASSRSQVQM